MSETPVADAPAPEAEATTEQKRVDLEQYPADHPLVKRLEALKAENKDLKPKAKRLTEIEEAAKSEAEKSADRIAKAEAEAAAVPSKVSDALRAHLVGLHEIDAEDAELFLTATDPDLLLKQVARLLGQSDKRQRKNHVPREGENPSAASNDEAAFARDFLGG